MKYIQPGGNLTKFMHLLAREQKHLVTRGFSMSYTLMEVSYILLLQAFSCFSKMKDSSLQFLAKKMS